MFLSRKPRHIAALAIKLQPMLKSEARNEILIRIGLRPSQLVVEMNNGKNDAEFMTQFEQQPQKRN